MEKCIFCQIIDKKLTASMVYEDDQLIAIHDRFPKAPTHILIIPKQHCTDLCALKARTDSALILHLWEAIPQIAALVGLHDGFRTIINTGRGGNQTVFHLHIHLLGRSKLPEAAVSAALGPHSDEVGFCDL